jgi:hypothetical protein
LATTLKVADQEYDIHAAQANKVKERLIINKSGLSEETSETIEFNGEIEQELSIVPIEGGTFEGKIRVPQNDEATIDNNAVLNYQDLTEKVFNKVITNSVLYEWNGTTASPALKNNQLNSISVIRGDISIVDEFAIYNNTNKYLSAYIYIGTSDDGSGGIYFGTADSDTAIEIAVGTAAEAVKLASARKIKIDLSKEHNPEPTDTDTIHIDMFDGSKNVELGITGVLPMSHGGLGGDLSTNTQLRKTAEYYINSSISENTAQVNDDTWLLFRNNSPSLTAGEYCRKKASAFWTYLAGKIRSTFGFSGSNDVLSPEHGGTGKSSLNDITVGKATSDGEGSSIRANYYRSASGTRGATETGKRITIDTKNPNDIDSGKHGAAGDIWIVYN